MKLLPLLFIACATVPYVGPTPDEMDAERAVCALYRLNFVPKVRFVTESFAGMGGKAEGDTVIVRRAPGQPLSATSFAHELFHFACGQRGDPTGDFNHTGQGWEGRPGSEVDAANEMLRARGE